MRKIEDERIISEKRRINSNAFSICLLLLWAILLYRQFVLQQNIKEYIDIFLLTIGISVYITINNVFKGLYLTYRNKKERKKAKFIGVIVGTVTFAIVQAFIAGYDFTNTKDVFTMIISIVIFFSTWLIAQNFLLNISEKKANDDIDEE